MATYQPRLLRHFLAAGLTLGLLASSGATAYAETLPPAEEVVTSNDSIFPEFDLSQERTEPFASSDSVEFIFKPKSPPTGGDLSMDALNPYKCYGKTQEVHRSYDAKAYASLHTKIIECNRRIDEMVNGAEIMKAGWFGLWHRTAFSAKTVYGKYSVDTNAKSYCQNNSMQTYRGNGYHRITHAGTNYIARTSGPESRFGCNN